MFKSTLRLNKVTHFDDMMEMSGDLGLCDCASVCLNRLRWQIT